MRSQGDGEGGDGVAIGSLDEPDTSYVKKTKPRTDEDGSKKKQKKSKSKSKNGGDGIGGGDGTPSKEEVAETVRSILRSPVADDAQRTTKKKKKKKRKKSAKIVEPEASVDGAAAVKKKAKKVRKAGTENPRTPQPPAAVLPDPNATPIMEDEAEVRQPLHLLTVGAAACLSSLLRESAFS